jgi:GAF domain-containing protein
LIEEYPWSRSAQRRCVLTYRASSRTVAPSRRRISLDAERSLLIAAKRTLEMVAQRAPLADVLAELCDTVDAESPEAMSTVMRMDPDGQRLWPVAGPRVPHLWNEAIAPVRIGPNMGSCGTAAFRKERVIISDIATDPLLSGLPETQSREIALGLGIRAAWSQPLLSRDDEVLGTFGMFHATPRRPSRRELRLIEEAGHIARQQRDQ